MRVIEKEGYDCLATGNIGYALQRVILSLSLSLWYLMLYFMNFHYKNLKKVYDRCGWKCYYCFRKLSMIRDKRNGIYWATIDHLIPKSQYTHTQDQVNLVLACRECNHRKANISAELFLQWYEWIAIKEWDVDTQIIAVKTRCARRWYHRFIRWGNY